MGVVQHNVRRDKNMARAGASTQYFTFDEGACGGRGGGPSEVEGPMEKAQRCIHGQLVAPGLDVPVLQMMEVVFGVRGSAATTKQQQLSGFAPSVR